ncbi:MAG: tRNA (N6-threonylcarbamoyladenosine(37)-N6)-methyltransferase TrmO [Methanosarcinaceae archaeon]|nr:tRNA (N6-threonylcarbamoyladenosine(37)-N6)-methyltransferase TrmO [Methanosarcinaceae archaeon]
MNSNDMTLKPVGYVSSPFKKRGDAPSQGVQTNEISTINIYEEYKDAIDGLSKGDYIFVLCWFDKSDRTVIKARRRGNPENPLQGVFSLRSPNRPNPISLTLVEILEIEDSVLKVKGLEAFDNTPVVDIKPYSKTVDEK